MNEEEVQTALSCESDDPPKLNAKMYVERASQTVFSYNPDLSNTAIRIELRTKNPKHDKTIASDTIIEQADEHDDGVGTAEGTDDGSGSPAQTDLSYQTTDVTLVVLTENEVGGEGESDDVETGEGRDVEESNDMGAVDDSNFGNFTEIDSNVSFYMSSAGSGTQPDLAENSKPLLTTDVEGNAEDDQDKKAGVLVQTGMVLGTGTVAPNAPGGQEEVTSDDKSKAIAVQTKFGGYPVDQSDTLIIEELQSRFPEHSQDAVVEPQVAGAEGDDSTPPPGGDEDVAAPDESGEQPKTEDTVPEETTDDYDLQNGDVTDTEETTKDAAEGAEPASTANGIDSGAQTVFSYDPMLSNSQLVDELANAYPKHSTENAVVAESAPPADVAMEEGVIPSSRTESKESFQSAVTSQPNMEDFEQSQAVPEAGANEQVAIIEEEAQTGIVCGVGKTSPENTSGNVVPELRSVNVQTVFGGYNVDQSDTKIVEELQFKDPVHSQRNSLEPIEETGSKPTEDTAEMSVVEEPLVVEIEETNDEIVVETNQDESDIQAEQDTEQGDVALDVDVRMLSTEVVDESQGETEESGEIIESAEENKAGDEENAIQESKTETADTEDLGSDDGTAVQTVLTCASLEEYPSKATRYVEQITQTVFSYNPDLSNTLILAELRTKQPEHESTMPPFNEEREEPAQVEGNEDEGAVADENAETGNPDVDESIPTADEVEGGEAVPAPGDEDGEATPDSPEETDGTTTGDNEEQPETDPGEKDAGAEVTETESAQFSENIQTDITCGIGSSTQLGSNNDKTQQTFFTYDKDVSNSNVIPELQSGHPIHSQLAVESAVIKAGECRGPCSQYAKEMRESPLPGVVDSEGEDYMTTTEGERTDDGEVTDASAPSDVESEFPELSNISSRQKITGPRMSMPATGSERDDSNSRERSSSYPPDKTQAKRRPVEFSTKVGDVEETDDDERQDTGAQTQIIFGTGTSPQGVNEKASNTYFTYDATQSDTQIIDELKTRHPVHSGEAVSFVSEDKERAGSEDSLFNDDWEKNESSGEGEIEVQDINATNSKASDWLAGASDVEVSDTEEENEGELDVQLTLVVESEDLEEVDGKQKTLIQTDLSFGDTLEPLPVSQQNTESSLSVHIMFSLQVGNSTDTMEMKVPKTDFDPSDAACTATFTAEFAGGGFDKKQSIDKEGNERIRCTLPILVTVTCESRTDDNGNAIVEPVVDLIFQKPPSNSTRALENQPEEVAPQSGVDELDNDPLVSPDDKREIEIQTDLVLGALLFSESISSVGGEEGFDTASEGPVHDEELILPSPPLEEPSSRTNVSWDDDSLEDVDNGPDMYVDLHLRVDPNDACNQQYVQQLVPSSRSQENCPVSDKSTTRTLMKITTAELLYVPDKVSSLTARNTQDKKVKVTGQKLHRWGFPHQNNLSNVTVIPDSFGFPVQKKSSSGLDDAENLFSTSYGAKSLNETTSGRVLTAVATRVIFEFLTSEEDDFLSTDGRAPAVKSKIAFQILESRDADYKSSHVATLDLKECTAPSKVMYMANGELTSKILQAEGSPLELPIDGGEPLVLKLALPQPRQLDESLATTTAVRKVPFTIAQVGDETLTTTKDLELGGSALQFTVPLGDGCGTMTVTAKVEDNSTDEESPEVITMTTTFEEADIQQVPKDGTAPAREVCICNKNKSVKTASPEKEEEGVVPLEEGGKSKTITAMFIKDGVPGEKQTKVLRPGGSPMYVNLPSSGVPIRAKLALAPQPDDEGPKTTSDGADLKTKVSCKIIQDGVEKETKTKLMEAGGSPLRFDLPIGTDGFLTANVIIPKTDNDVSGESAGQSDGATGNVTEECVCETVDPCECQTESEVSSTLDGKGDTTKKETRPQTTSGDRCFDVITEALATYAREIDPLRRALEEITEKVKELNMPELAGIGEPPCMSYHSLDELDDQQIFGMQELTPPPPPPVSYQHKITLQTGMSRVSTTIHSRPNLRQQRPVNSPSSQRQWRETGMEAAQQYPADVATCQQQFRRGPVQTPTCPLYQNPTSYSLPESPQARCPSARTPDQYQSEQLCMQQSPPPPQQLRRRGSGQAPGGYMERPPAGCPYAADNANVQPLRHMPQNQAYGQPNQDPRYYGMGVRLSQPPPYQYQMPNYPTTPNQNYDDYAPSAVNIRSRVYLSSDGLRSREQDPRNGPRSCNPDTGYDDYAPQQRSPIAEMYIKLSQNSRSSQFYEEDEDSLYGDEDDRGYGAYQRRGYATVSQKKLCNRGREDDRRKAKPRGSKGCVCSASATDVGTSITTIDLGKTESYWCDPEDVTGSTKPGSLGNAAISPGVN